MTVTGISNQYITENSMKVKKYNAYIILIGLQL